MRRHRDPLSTVLLLLALPGCAGSTSGSTPPPAEPIAAAPAAAAAPSPGPGRPEGAPAPSQTGPAAPDVPKGAAATRDAELSQKASALFGLFGNTDLVWSRDGRRVIFASDRDGVPQLYAADARHPESKATRLVERADRVILERVTPDGKAVLFRSDHGADENWSIFRVDLEGKAVTELTPGEKLNRDGPRLPERPTDSFFFSARRLSEAASAVYAASIVAPGPARRIYRDEKPGFLVDVSPDGKAGLFVRHASRSENVLLLLDLGSGEAKPLYPPSGKVSIFDAAFSADGARVLLSTDGGGEQALLLSIERKTGRELARYVETHPATATPGRVIVARRGGMVALDLAAGNHDEVRLLDVRTLKPRAKVILPPGSGFARSFSEDGRRLGLVWSTPSQPTDLYAVDPETGTAAPLRKEERPALAELPDIATATAEVKAKDGLTIPIHYYLPATTGAARHPVIVSYHGGPAGVSVIRWSPIARFFVSLGYAWVEPNVRGSSGFGRAFEEADNGHKRLDAFGDIEASARWAAAQPFADKNRVIVFGGSYGGYTVLLALTRWPDLFRAGVDLFGVANLKTFMATTSGLIRELFLVEFGDPDKDATFMEAISPLHDVQRIRVPLFVYAGANDPRVPRTESDLIVNALRARGVPVEYMVKENEGHSLSHRENQVEFCARAARFLEAHAQ